MYWRTRQDSVADRWAIDFEGDALKPHELLTVERLLLAGHRLKWIPKSPVHVSTHDFEWLSAPYKGIKIEMKAPKAKWTTIRRAIRDAVVDARDNHRIVKDHFLIDLGLHDLTDELRSDLARYNIERSRSAIKRLWVMSHGQLEEVRLET